MIVYVYKPIKYKPIKYNPIILLGNYYKLV